MSEPLFLNSVMQEKSGVVLNFVMSLATTFQAKRLVSIGQYQLTQMVFLR